MPLEDFTTYTEVDPNSHITVTTNRIDFTGLNRNETAYVYKDFGANHFDGDFEHLFQGTLASGVQGAFCLAWGVANLVNNYKAIRDASGDAFFIAQNEIASNALQIVLYETDGGTSYADVYNMGVEGSVYYYTVKRDEAIGTYGTLSLYIYDDSARTSLVDILSIALHSSKKDFRYLYATNTFNDGANFPGTGFIEDIDLGLAVANGFPFFFGAGHY